MAGTPTNLVLALLSEFARDMRAAKSINQIALSSGKAYANVHAVATTLIKEDILIKETIGHSHLCRLNLGNDKTLLYLSLLETVKRDDLLKEKPHLRALLEQIDEESAHLGIVLAWYREHDLLLVTTNGWCDRASFSTTPRTIITLSEFFKDQELRSTISDKGTLLFGHALYVSMLKEKQQQKEVLR